MPEILYLATDFFLKGGIQRYSRAQVNAIREAVGARRVTTLSVHSAGARAFEEPFQTDYAGGGTSLAHRIRYVQACFHFVSKKRYDVVWVNHISLLPLGVLLSKIFHISHVILNIYGLEMWSNLRFQNRWFLHYATKIIADCHFTANYTKETFSLPSVLFTVIWDPVDTARFQPMDSAAQVLPRYGIEYERGRTYLMTLGRVSVGARHKGYDRMLDTIKQIERNDVVYLIVGDGDDGARLKERVAQEGLEERVFFLGSIPESDLVAVYNAADIFVLVSDRGPGRGEGVPLTPLEAASCGKPIIVGDEDGSPEAVRDGVNGYIVSPHELDTLKSRILTLVADPETRKKMGTNARVHMIENFSYELFTKKTQGILRDMELIK